MKYLMLSVKYLILVVKYLMLSVKYLMLSVKYFMLLVKQLMLSVKYLNKGRKKIPNNFQTFRTVRDTITVTNKVLHAALLVHKDAIVGHHGMKTTPADDFFRSTLHGTMMRTISGICTPSRIVASFKNQHLLHIPVHPL